MVIFDQGDRLLNKEDNKASEIIQNVFIEEGIPLVLSSKIQLVVKTEQAKIIYFINNGK